MVEVDPPPDFAAQNFLHTKNRMPKAKKESNQEPPTTAPAGERQPQKEGGSSFKQVARKS